jgi:hypothetical protein
VKLFGRVVVGDGIGRGVKLFGRVVVGDGWVWQCGRWAWQCGTYVRTVSETLR